jgi:transposase
MKAYSLDLRERVLQAVDRGLSKSEVARLFNVGRATVKRYLALRRATGFIAAKKSTGRPRLIALPAEPALVAQLTETPDATLAEHCTTWEQTQHGQVSVATMHRSILRAGWTRKKKTIKAAEQDWLARIGWSIFLRFIDARECVFVDETSTTTTMTRRYARAPHNERAVGEVPRNHGTSTTLIGALSLDGLGAAMTVSGAVDEAVMVAYVRELLCPSLHPGQIVFMDNLSSHKGETVRTLIEQAGCTLIFLPPYSPEFSPIEQAFSKLKEFLRATGARTQDALDAAITAAIELVTKLDARHWFKHCGYQVLDSPLAQSN